MPDMSAGRAPAGPVAPPRSARSGVALSGPSSPRRREGEPSPSVCVLEGHAFASWAAGHRAGEHAGALPFGVDALERAGYSVAHADAVWRGGRARAWARERSRPLGYQLRADGAVAQVLTSLGPLRRSAACVSLFEDQGLAYCGLRRIAGAHLPPLVMVSCWLGQRLVDGDERRRRAYRVLAREASLVTVFSRNQLRLLAEALELPVERLVAIDFGVDTDFYRPGPAAAEPYVAVVGKDAGRDWPTLLAAASLTPAVRYVLATDPARLASLAVPSNVTVLGMLGHREYRALVGGSMFSVVPTRELAYPTGQSVLLESLACGRPVVAARTGAMQDYLVAEATAGYDVGDADGLAVAIGALAGDEERRRAMSAAARRAALDRFDSRIMWRRIGALIDQVLDDPVLDDPVLDDPVLDDRAPPTGRTARARGERRAGAARG